MTHKTRTTPVTTTLLSVALLGIVALSGCIGFESDADKSTDTSGMNQPPVATLDPIAGPLMTREAVTFDAQASSDPDGYITIWRFDFGDGTVEEVYSEDEARLDHTYEMGGVYTATLTVFDNGTHRPGGQAGMGNASGDADAPDKADTRRNATTSVMLAVNDRVNIDVSVVNVTSNLAPGLAYSSLSFDGNEGIDHFELNLAMASTLVAGGTTVRVYVMDADNVTIAHETVTIGASDNETLSLSGPLAVGVYTLTIHAESGAASAQGELRTYYVAPTA